MSTLQKLNDCQSSFGKTLYIAFSLFLLLSYLFVFELNRPTVWDPRTGVYLHPEFNHYIAPDQYGRLADSLIAGKVTLDLQVPDELASLDDPYDYDTRREIGSESVPIYWDHAFFKGQYYCYFGVVPAALVYVPYRLITGEMLYTPYAIRFIGGLSVIALCLFVRRFCMNYFAKSVTTFTLIIVASLLFFSSNLIYLAFVPMYYSVPMVSSVLFTALGFWFFLGAKKNENGTLSLRHMIAGSLCLALNLGCRPQFILFSFVALGFFWKELFHDKILRTRQGHMALLAVTLSYVVVFIPLLLYNQVRFGSLFDFGSNYNLTGFNMPKYNQSNKVTQTLIFDYLFQQITYIPTFPFIAKNPIQLPVKEWIPNEPFYGGIFSLVPAFWIILLFPAVWKEMRERYLLPLFLVSLVLSMVTLVLDTRTTGITQRYFTDFVPYIAISTIIVFYCLQIRLRQTSRSIDGHLFTTLCCLFILFTAITTVMMLFSPERFDPIAILRPHLYRRVAGLFAN